MTWSDIMGTRPQTALLISSESHADAARDNLLPLLESYGWAWAPVSMPDEVNPTQIGVMVMDTECENEGHLRNWADIASERGIPMCGHNQLGAWLAEKRSKPPKPVLKDTYGDW